MSVMERSIPALRPPASPVAKVVWRVSARPAMVLVVTVYADGNGVAELRDAGGTREVIEFRGVIRIDADAALLHIDSPRFSATIKLGGGLLYARTDVIARLGVPGGRYEISGE